MLGVIDVGGGLRGIYGAGILDRCIDDGITFDCCIGVSAGAANLSSFLAHQKKRNYTFYTEYPFRKDYMSVENILKKGEYLSLDYVYSVLSNSGGENPLDFDTLNKFDGIFNIVATNAEIATPTYFEKSDIKQDDYSILKASCCIPIVSKAVTINNFHYFDGGISDPIPIDRAFSLGCDKVVLILTKPKNYRKRLRFESTASKILKNQYPKTSELLLRRAELYNNSVEKAIEMENEGKCLIVAPDDCCGVDTLTKSKKNLNLLYNKAYSDAVVIKKFAEDT